MIKKNKLKIVVCILFLLSYLTPFYSIDASNNGHKYKVVKLGFQIVSDYWFSFILFGLAIAFYFFSKVGSRELRKSVLLLSFIYLSIVIFTFNIFNVPLPILKEFIVGQANNMSYGFYSNIILGLLIYGLSFPKQSVAVQAVS